MAADKKINELPITSVVTASDVSVLVHSGTDYQFTFNTLLDFVNASVNSGASISFGNTTPQNITGKNGDIFINTSIGSFAQKTSGIWLVKYTLPSLNDAKDGTVLYGSGVPGGNIGNDNDTYIDTNTGVFYNKNIGQWAQVFSMQTGPQGPKGDKGNTGAVGENGKTILHGSNNPSNSTIGANGDFYINTNTYQLFGPKANDDWGRGVSILTKVSDERYQKNTSSPTLSNWQDSDAEYYGNFPRLKLLIEDEDGNEIEAPGTSPKYTIDRTNPANPLVTAISWDLSAPTNCRILIN